MDSVKNHRYPGLSTALAALVSFGMALALVGAPNQAFAKHAAAPAASPTPVQIENPAVTKIARQQFISWQAGAINRKLYTSDLSALITQEKLDETSTELGQLGAYVSVNFVDDEPIAMGVPPGSKTYLYQMHGTVGAVYMQITVTPDGKVASLAFRNSIYDFHPTPTPPTPSPEPTDPPSDSGDGY